MKQLCVFSLLALLLVSNLHAQLPRRAWLKGMTQFPLTFFLLISATWASQSAEAMDFSLSLTAIAEPFSLWKNRIVPITIITVGAGMLGIWAADMATGKFREQGNFFQWRNDGGDRLWLHIVAEYLTAGSLIAGGIGLLVGHPWGLSVSLVSLGALTYTSINSLSWVFAEKGRISYGIPIMVSLAGSIVSLAILLN